MLEINLEQTSSSDEVHEKIQQMAGIGPAEFCAVHLRGQSFTLLQCGDLIQGSIIFLVPLALSKDVVGRIMKGEQIFLHLGLLGLQELEKIALVVSNIPRIRVKEPFEPAYVEMFVVGMIGGGKSESLGLPAGKGTGKMVMTFIEGFGWVADVPGHQNKITTEVPEYIRFHSQVLLTPVVAILNGQRDDMDVMDQLQGFYTNISSVLVTHLDKASEKAKLRYHTSDHL
jgi:hypothetical protein